MRTASIRIALGLGLGASALLALASPAGAAQPNDAWITTKVKMALLTETGADALAIDVDTFDGAVTLHGQVDSDAARLAAEKRARGIRGVTQVRNLLAVVPDAAAEAVEADDEAIRRQVETVLERDQALAGSDIRVESVNDGIVVLAGRAQTLSAHRRALEDASEVEGVREVASQIQSPDELGDAEIWAEAEVRDAGSRMADAAADAWITTRAKLRLMSEPGLSPLAINVDTRHGVVTLFGIVGTEDVKRRAGARVDGVPGVTAVENELQVVPDTAAPAVERQDALLRDAVRERLAGREALADARIDLKVKNATVRLTGEVASQADRLTALTVARATRGVDAVIDDLNVKPPQS